MIQTGIFGRFGDWYPDYFFVEELNKEEVVVNNTYFPLAPKLDESTIQRYFNGK